MEKELVRFKEFYQLLFDKISNSSIEYAQSVELQTSPKNEGNPATIIVKLSPKILDEIEDATVTDEILENELDLVFLITSYYKSIYFRDDAYPVFVEEYYCFGPPISETLIINGEFREVPPKIVYKRDELKSDNHYLRYLDNSDINAYLSNKFYIMDYEISTPDIYLESYSRIIKGELFFVIDLSQKFDLAF